MNSTDFLNLSEHKIIENVKKSLPGNISKALNVLTVKDNVLFTWDFQSNCVLTLNIKATRENMQNEAVICQKLLPLSTTRFSPEKIIANEVGTLLIVAGPTGVLVFKLPARCPPYGSFNNNKELVYCQTFCLDEWLLTCSDIEVLQVRFHPGSVMDNHILVLTSDNALRLYRVEDEIINLGVFQVGDKPMAKMPCSKMTFLGALGETAVDFDFGHPEINGEIHDKPIEYNKKNTFKKALVKVFDQPNSIITIIQPSDNEEKDDKKVERTNYSQFNWPVYILSGDFVITTINIPLYKKTDCSIKGPLPLTPRSAIGNNKRACSILCLNSNPQVICIGSTNGVILHGIVLPTIEKNSQNEEKLSSSEVKIDREIFFFEAVNIELGLSTILPPQEEGYTCAIFLHKDDSRSDRYFATHSAGIHSITIGCMNFLETLANSSNASDIFSISSIAEYLVCTRTASTKNYNPVIGFSVYYNPTSIIGLLANGSLVSLALSAASILPKMEKLSLETEEIQSTSMKEIFKVPFEQCILNLLKKADSHPIMKLSKGEEHSLKDCHELIQKTAHIFKEKFKYHTLATEEIEKRATAIQMLKQYQIQELENMTKEKRSLQEKAENLAEKYEDIRDKQSSILRRCAKLLIVLSMKKEVLSDAEADYLQQLKTMRTHLNECDAAIEKLIAKKNYQECQMRNWKSQQQKKSHTISEKHKNIIKDSLVDSSTQINGMIEEVKSMKERLRLK